MLHVENLEVRRGGVSIVRGASLEVAAGERVALLGPSGAGKTALLRGVAALETDWSGRLSWDGETLAAMGPRRWRRRVVLVAQRPAMFPGTVADNVAFAARYHGLRPEVANWLDLLDLPADRAADALSEGEKQRVALARALAVQPAVLLLDEPTSALDPARVERVEHLLAEVEAALVLVTHDAAQAERLATRQVGIHEGRLL